MQWSNKEHGTVRNTHTRAELSKNTKGNEKEMKDKRKKKKDKRGWGAPGQSVGLHVRQVRYGSWKKNIEPVKLGAKNGKRC